VNNQVLIQWIQSTKTSFLKLALDPNGTRLSNNGYKRGVRAMKKALGVQAIEFGQNVSDKLEHSADEITRRQYARGSQILEQHRKD
jgi:hypothetical protein